jgi:signal transduction histidine kinase
MRFLKISALALLCAFVLAFMLSGNLRRPIVRLVRATRQLSAGNLAARVNNTGGSREMEELANSFNSMAISLETRSRELEQTSQALKQAYTEADEKNRAYLEMLGFVTHELKSPLASIVFAIGSLREGMLGPLTDSQQSTLKAAASSADYLNSTIANYLNLSRIEEGELKLKLSSVSLLDDIANPVIQRLGEVASDNKMRITCNVSPGIKVTVDRDLLTSVFQNLLSNAIKYGSRGGEIVIGASRQGDGMHRINVFNEGLGFAPQAVDALFTKFSRFHAESYDTKTGTGLGLFVTRKIVERHGGQIWAESEPGKWANFIFTLPAQTPVDGS